MLGARVDPLGVAGAGADGPSVVQDRDLEVRAGQELWRARVAVAPRCAARLGTAALRALAGCGLRRFIGSIGVHEITDGHALAKEMHLPNVVKQKVRDHVRGDIS